MSVLLDNSSFMVSLMFGLKALFITKFAAIPDLVFLLFPFPINVFVSENVYVH